MENREYLNSLFDIYKELLTKVEQITFIDYYIEDLSLQEIADNRSISKSSVAKSLKSAVDKLESYENKLHNLENKLAIIKACNDRDYNAILKLLEKW